jgi:hypothetical protein
MVDVIFETVFSIWYVPKFLEHYPVPGEYKKMYFIVEGIHRMKLQCRQNRVLRIIGKFPRGTPLRDIHMTYQIPYMYDYVNKSCRQQTQVIQNSENANVYRKY